MKYIAILVAGLIIVEIMVADAFAGGLARGGSTYRAGTPERSVTLTPDNASMGRTPVIKQSGSVGQSLLPKPNPIGKGILTKPQAAKPIANRAATGAILQQILPQAINAGAQLLQKAKDNSGNGSNERPGKLLNRQSRNGGQLLGRVRQRGNVEDNNYTDAESEPSVSLANDSHVPQAPVAVQSVSTSEQSASQDNSLGDMLAREFFRDVMNNPTSNLQSYANLPVDKNDPIKMEMPNLTSKPNESLADRLAREDGHLINNYMKFHDRNTEKLYNDIGAIRRGFFIVPLKEHTKEDIDNFKKQHLDAVLDYYNREVDELRNLNAALISNPEWANQRIRERRQELLNAADALDQLK